MTPEQAKAIANNDSKMIKVEWLSHFAQLVRQSKERYEGFYEIPWCDSWFSQPTNEYNPGLAYAGMGICLSGYKNLPSNDYKYIKGSFAAIGCEDVDITSYYHLNDENYITALDNVNRVSYAMGHRKIMAARNGEAPTQRDLLIFMVRGTSVSVEWNSNSNVANSVANGEYDVANHEGFRKSGEAAYYDMKAYMNSHDLDLENAIVWVIGHSRGAAVANVVASLFDEDDNGIDKSRIYSYCYSASTTTRRSDANGPSFDNIFNIMNPEDYVPRIPPVEWDFVRFGRDLYLPSIAANYEAYMQYRDEFLSRFKEWTRVDFPAFHGNAQTNWFQRHIYDISPNAADMYCHNRYTSDGTITFAQYFRLVTDIAGQKGNGLINDGKALAFYGTGLYERFLSYLLRNQVVGHLASGAHQEEGYLIKLMLCYEMDIDIEKDAVCDTKRFTVYGPVRLVVKNAAGQVVASIDKGKIDESLYETQPDYIAMYYDKDVDASQVWVPQTRSYAIEIVALDDQPHDVCLSTLTPMGDVLDQEFYEGVQLPKDETVVWSKVKPAQPTKAVSECDNLCAEVKVVGEPSVLEANQVFNLWSDYGDSQLGFQTKEVVADALAVRNATYGDHVAVHAYHAPYIKFEGWYENGQLVSTDKSYVFRITENRDLEARFIAKEE